MVGIDFGKPLFTSEEIQRKIHELGSRISADYADKDLHCGGRAEGRAFLHVRPAPVTQNFGTAWTSSTAPARPRSASDGNPVLMLADMKADIRGSMFCSWKTSWIPASRWITLKKCSSTGDLLRSKSACCWTSRTWRKVQIEADYAGIPDSEQIRRRLRSGLSGPLPKPALYRSASHGRAPGILKS